jgi:geranylgeranyl pyrophosphate synthase
MTARHSAIAASLEEMHSMQIPVLTLPRLVPSQRERPPQTGIPAQKAQREAIRQQVAQYVRRFAPVPPLSFEELRQHATRFSELGGVDLSYRDYIAVLLNSEVWREQLASVPFERRLLLLPKCLRVEDKCPAPFDDFGLLCKQCGLCSIQDLQSEAERMGYAVLVAEGSALVMAIIQTGKIDAIVGVSCLSVLEKAFPYMESAAIPGVAIPLLQDDCKDTTIDLDWVWDVIHLTSDDRTYRLNLDAVRSDVDAWFEPPALRAALGPDDGQTRRIAQEWLGRAGKRWRPFLAACAYKALASDPHAPLPAGLARVALAVECFHKASLVHDDIEDRDDLRYGEKTLHAEHGEAIALNVGDLLLGDGYQLLADADAAPLDKARMFSIAAAGHRTLCLGQGAELTWARSPAPLTSLQVLDIFRRKTAPAFEVALKLGAAYAGAGADVDDVLSRYSDALGIAYQIRDDLEDLGAEPATGDGESELANSAGANHDAANGDGANARTADRDTAAGAAAPRDDIAAGRPTLPLAIAFERSSGADRAFLEAVWRRTVSGPQISARVRALIVSTGAKDRCAALLDSYKQEAIRSLTDLEDPSLKGLLRRVISKIFSMEIQGWCSEFEARNAAGRATGAHAAG